MVIKTLLIPGFHSRLCWLRAVVSIRKYFNANSQEQASVGFRVHFKVARGGRSVLACDKHRAPAFRFSENLDFVRSGYKRNKTVFCYITCFL